MAFEALPVCFLVRHGQTAWSLTGQHTGLADIPLTEAGEGEARALADRLRGRAFAKIFTSPLQRARRTCAIAGYEATAEIDADLTEWHYGQYEGWRRAEILAERPGWYLFRDGCPGGEMPMEVAVRADRVIRRIRAVQGDVLIFSSGHIMRMIAARWLELEPSACGLFYLGTASVSHLGYEHDFTQPLIRLWNDTSHLGK